MGFLLAPFRFVWNVLSTILGTVGRLLMGLVGVGLIVFGIMLTLTVGGAIFGIPLIILGSAVVTRALY